jgi:hypothetical protein
VGTPSDLIDRYTAEIARYLPPSARSSVTAEIGGELRGQVRATEAHSGRAMSEDEIAALIRMRGHPYVLAQPYRTGRYLLIGPSLVPQYFRALKTALTLAFLFVTVVTAVFAASGTAPVVLVQYLSVFARMALPIAVIVTIGYAVYDVVHGRLLLKQGWDPRGLRAVDSPSAPQPRGSFADVITSGLFLIWWFVLPHYPWIVLGPGNAFLHFSDGWRASYPWVAACFVTSFAIHVVAIVRPPTSWLSRWRTVLANAASVLGAGLLLGAGDLLVASDGTPLDTHALAWINQAIRWCLVWTMIIGIGQLIRVTVKKARRPSPSVP